MTSSAGCCSSAVRRRMPAQVTTVVPYLCYARKDRRTKPHDPIYHTVHCGEVRSRGHRSCHSVRSPQRCSIRKCVPMPDLAHRERLTDGGTFCLATARRTVGGGVAGCGGAKRTEQFRQTLEHLTCREVGSAYMEKFRSSRVVSGELLAGDVHGRTAVIIDDSISTGRRVGTGRRRVPSGWRHAGLCGGHLWAVHRWRKRTV